MNTLKQRQDAKDYIATGIQAFKLLFYASITGGIIWNVLYFGSVVKSLPKLGISDIPIYLISIFGTGFFFIILIVSYFMLPGWIFYQMRSKAVKDRMENGFSFPHIMCFFYTTISLIAIALLFMIIKAVFFFMSAILIIPIVTIVLALYVLRKLHKHDENKITDLADKFRQSFDNIDREIVIAGFISIFLFTIISVFFALGLSVGVESATKDTIKAIIAFSVTLFLATIINSLIAAKGLSFYAFSRNHIFNAVAAFSIIAFVLIIFLSPLIEAKSNPFLTFPYRQLKLGLFHARLTVDEKYMQALMKTMQIKNHNNSKGEKLQQLFSTPCFLVLSSIGEYFIVKFADDEKCEAQNLKADKDNKKKEDSKNQNNQLGAYSNYIFRIPTDKVFSVAYLDDK